MAARLARSTPHYTPPRANYAVDQGLPSAASRADVAGMNQYPSTPYTPALSLAELSWNTACLLGTLHTGSRRWRNKRSSLEAFCVGRDILALQGVAAQKLI